MIIQLVIAFIILNAIGVVLYWVLDIYETLTTPPPYSPPADDELLN